MTNDELLEMARELNGRGEAYALVTVVRAIAPTSAYLGAQAIVLADGTLHGWIGGGCAKDVVIGAAQSAIENGEPKLVRISQRPDLSRRGCRAATRCPAPATARSSCSSSLTAPAARCACSGARPPPTRRASSRSGCRIRLTDTPDEAPVVLVATQGQGDEEALEAALRSPAMHVLMIASRRKADRLRDVMRMRGIDEVTACALAGARGPGCRRQDTGRDRAGRDRRRAGVAARSRRKQLRPQEADECTGQEPRSRVRTTRLTQQRREAKFINPVCGMAVDTATPMHVEKYEGVAYYFCCDGCRTTFRQDPAKYAAIHRASAGVVPA